MTALKPSTSKAVRNFIQALRDGEVDGILMWEPFESEAGATGIGSFAAHLDYSTSSAIDGLGVIAASSKAITEKRETLRRFLWGYLTRKRAHQVEPNSPPLLPPLPA